MRNGAEVPRHPTRPVSAGHLMTAAPVLAPSIEQGSVPFTIVHSDVIVSCSDADVNFECKAGYEEPARSWLPDDMAENHACFQAAGIPYTVTYFKRQECSECDLSCTDCIHNADDKGRIDGQVLKHQHPFGQIYTA